MEEARAALAAARQELLAKDKQLLEKVANDHFHVSQVLPLEARQVRIIKPVLS